MKVMGVVVHGGVIKAVSERDVHELHQVFVTLQG